MSNSILPSAIARKWLYVVMGPAIFLIIQLTVGADVMPLAARSTLACTLWIAIWWITEAIPIAATSLLPLVLFPVTGALGMSQTANPYSNPIIYLYAGGFMIALAMEKWNLHRRIALNIISLTGTNMHQIILGFMLATAFLSMWISNTATSVMMLPIGIAIVQQFQHVLRSERGQEEGDKFAQALMLGIAYAASIGGISTLVGSPTNLVFSGFIQRTYGVDIAFSQWMMLGVPISAFLLIICWQHLVKIAYRLGRGTVYGGKELIDQEKKMMGKMSAEEKRVLGVFVAVAFLWISRKYLINPFFPPVNDTIIALAGALILFIIPSPSKPHNQLMDWQTALKLPWGILLLFGGGFAIAEAFDESGLAAWMGEKLVLLETVPFFLILLIIIFTVNFLTEITSNVATCTLMMPVLAELAPSIGVHPYGMMIGATMAASCAFMLPVATPPNAVVFGSSYLKISDMVRAGFLLNMVSVIIITLFLYYLLPYVWDINLEAFPAAFAK